ncbi:hypothetical protein ACGIF2_10745 [Cellulomonas sp. P22]|uniref:CG0192-related protein n=1 Tax=Cellulomonas sp. P22 TaxID=3373189 RepID=UPI0037A4CB24
MAILYSAQLHPTKLELLAGWLPTQPWFAHDADVPLDRVGAYRFDDPAGEVGVETILVRADDTVLQVPLTYRDAPLPGADPWLVGTMEHSVLGTRWVYDACTDPVYAATLASVVLGDAVQAEEVVVTPDGEHQPRTPSTVVRAEPAGSATDAPAPPVDGPVPCSTTGRATTILIGGAELTVLRVLDLDVHGSALPALVGTWPEQAEPVLLATARPI